MNQQDFSNYIVEAKKHTLKTIVPKIVVGGVCGAGKSSLLNAIVRGRAFEIDPSKPCTRNNDETQINAGDAPIRFMDSPGFSEADKESQDYAGNIRRLVSEEAHLYLLVIGAPNRSLDVENKWLNAAHTEEMFSKIPGLVAINKIDIVQPTRDWNPDKLNLANPVTPKEKNIVDYMKYVSEISEFRRFAAQDMMIPVSAGESFDDPLQYNIVTLRKRMFDLLPDAAKIEFARQVYMQQKAAEIIINRYAIAVAAEVLINPLALGSDALIIVPMQIAMTIHIAKIYGQNITWSFAASLFGTMAATFVGRTIASTIIGLIPIVKNIAGPAVAYGLTRALGMGLTEIFASNLASGSQEVIESIARKYADSIKIYSEECPDKKTLIAGRSLD